MDSREMAREFNRQVRAHEDGRAPGSAAPIGMEDYAAQNTTPKRDSAPPH